MRENAWRYVLCAIAALQMVAFVYYAAHVALAGYLPAPFVFDKSNTFMDLFHPMFWAWDDGRYTVWSSVYPPLNFLLLGLMRLVGQGGDWFPNGFLLRDAGHFVIWIYLAAAFAGLWFTVTKFKAGTLDRTILFVAFAASPPFLFALERGNILALLLPLVAIAAYENGWKRALSIALLINFKPYFVLLLLPYLFKADFRWAAATAMLSGGIFLLTGMAVDPNFLAIVSAYSAFSQAIGGTSPGNFLTMASSIDAWAYAINYLIAAGAFGSGLRMRGLQFVASMVTFANYAAMLVIFGSAVFAASRLKYAELMLLSVLLAINYSVSAGGYSLVFLIPFVAVMASMRLRVPALAALAVCFLPWDIIGVPFDRSLELPLFLTGQMVHVTETITPGALLRPAASLSLIIIMIFELLGRRLPGSSHQEHSSHSIA